MNDMMLTAPQEKVVDYLNKHGDIEADLMKSCGLNLRAANNLVKARVLTLTNGVFRLRGRKAVEMPAPQPKKEAQKETAPTKAVMKTGAPAAKASVKAAAPMQVDAPAKAGKAKVAKVVNATGKCLCGCGAEIGPKRRFAMGHDAKLHSLVLRVFRGKADKSELPTSEATTNYLRTAPWMKDEIREALGL